MRHAKAFGFPLVPIAGSTHEPAGAIPSQEFASLNALEVVGYYSGRQCRNSMPFRVVEFDRSVFGGGVQYGHRGRLLGHRNRFTIGVDVQHQDDRRRNFDNVNGQPGETLLLLQDERVTNVGPYVQNELYLLKHLILLLGGRYDHIHFVVDDLLTSDGDDSGSRTFSQLIGRAGLLFSLLPEVHLYINVAQSFETPTTTELVNRPTGGGGINPDLDPQRALNYELGVKGQAWQRLAYELAVFFITLQDELIRFSDATGRDFFRNAGESHRYGVELGLSLALLQGLRVGLAYTYLDAVFDEFVKPGGVDLEGNTVPGLPPHQVYGEIFYRHLLGFDRGLEVLYVDSFFVDDENTETNDASTVANLRLGYDHAIGRWLLSLFFGIQNLFDEAYNSNVRINADGGRFFEPAPDFNVYGGLAVTFRW